MSGKDYRDNRKIDPSLGDTLGDGSPNDNDRIEIGPTQLAFAEWSAAGLTLPNLARMREYRWQRLTLSSRSIWSCGLVRGPPFRGEHSPCLTD